MAKSKETDVTDIILEGHKQGIKNAIEIACRKNTSLIVQKGDKLVEVKPKYKYIRVRIKKIKKKA